MREESDRIRKALTYVPARDRETWLRMGMAVKSQLGDEGFDLWSQWSKQDESYNERDARHVWKSICVNGKVSIGSLYYEAKRNGWFLQPGPALPSPAVRSTGSERPRNLQTKTDNQTHSETAARIADIWAAATGDPVTHPYALKKAVSFGPLVRRGAWRQRAWADALLIPIVGADGRIRSIEAIDADGNKDYLRGAQKRGGFYQFGEIRGAVRLLIGEGVATVAAAVDATKLPAIAAMDAGNLTHAARAVRELNPNAELIFLADNDTKSDGSNPGIKAATAAALAMSGRIAIPELNGGACDWWDVWRQRGREVVKAAIDTPALPDTGELVAGLVCGADINPESVAWLWDGWLAKDVLQIIAGAPGTGKTTAALAFAAVISAGERWPDGSRAEPGDVLIWSGEDVVSKTLVPRLLAMGADMKRVHFVDTAREVGGTRPFDPATDMPQLRAAIRLTGIKPKLLVVDPIVSAVAGDSHKNSETRRALQPLVDLAEAEGCAVLGVSHFSKGTAGRDVVERVTGSLAFAAQSRLVLVAAKMREDQGGGRLLARAKSNIGPDDGGYRYELRQVALTQHPGISASCVLWGDAIQGSAREILAQAEAIEDSEERTSRTEAADWLRELLNLGRMKSQDVKRKAEQMGFAWRTVQRAKEAATVEVKREGFGPDAVYYWSLSPCVPKQTMYATPEQVARMREGGAHEQIGPGKYHIQATP